MKEIKIPVLGESVTEATIANWVKKEGEKVLKDELILELETDKVTLEVNAPEDGVLVEVIVAEGDIVTPHQLVAKIDPSAAGASVSVLNNDDHKESESGLQEAQNNKVVSVNSAFGFDGAAPSAKKIAAENNIDISQMLGSGKDGRVIKGDVLNAVAAGLKAPVMAASPSATEDDYKREEIVPMSGLRKKIAERLKFSQNTAAILTTFNEVDMTNIINMRARYQDKFIKKHNVKLGFMSFFAKAAVKGLKEIPAVNAEIADGKIIYKHYHDIGIAVGTDQGLVVPVVRNVDNLSFAAIEQEISNLGKKAKEGKLSIKDLTGGTFSITNGGVYGSLLSTPIINPPQSAILGMHAMQDRVVVIDGKIEIRKMMYLALSYDHRIIDGKEAVTFLVKIKEAIENPESLLLDV